jgi:hypothetical protein
VLPLLDKTADGNSVFTGHGVSVVCHVSSIGNLRWTFSRLNIDVKRRAIRDVAQRSSTMDVRCDSWILLRTQSDMRWTRKLQCFSPISFDAMGLLIKYADRTRAGAPVSVECNTVGSTWKRTDRGWSIPLWIRQGLVKNKRRLRCGVCRKLLAGSCSDGQVDAD